MGYGQEGEVGSDQEAHGDGGFDGDEWLGWPGRARFRIRILPFVQGRAPLCTNNMT